MGRGWWLIRMYWILWDLSRTQMVRDKEWRMCWFWLG